MLNPILLEGGVRMSSKIVPLIVLLLALPAAVQADTAGDKALRGLAGMTTGFLELPGNIAVETEERGPGVGIPVGAAKGLGMIVARELVGVYELVTSPIPVPENYEPVMQPEYPWGYFEARDVRESRY
jgi:putative exosortase-associated protein (TIGR04073 family)